MFLIYLIRESRQQLLSYNIRGVLIKRGKQYFAQNVNIFLLRILGIKTFITFLEHYFPLSFSIIIFQNFAKIDSYDKNAQKK